MKANIKIHPKVINDVYKPLLDSSLRFEVVYGGAGSGKSVFIAQRTIYRHLRDKGRRTLIVRKVGRTNRHSTFALINQVIGSWNVKQFFNVNKSDMEITCINGNKIIFSGLDDVEKLKSIAGITDIWIEEASEITQEDFQQLNLRLRGLTEVQQQITLTFNPISALSWIKSYFFDNPKDNALVLKTTYKDNRFLNAEYIQEIENLINVDPVYYQIYAKGEWGVLGNLVYTNYIIEPFDKDIKSFSSVYNGLDWGYNDPTALVRIGLKDSELYIFDEMYVKGKTNPELMKEAEGIISKSDLVTADSSEPKSIQEWKYAGWNIKGADKGKDSISYGIDFVRRHKIHIHPDCQNFINEIQGYAYQKDKEGNVLEDPIDFKNHLMDAMRYALERLSKHDKVRFLK